MTQQPRLVDPNGRTTIRTKDHAEGRDRGRNRVGLAVVELVTAHAASVCSSAQFNELLAPETTSDPASDGFVLTWAR